MLYIVNIDTDDILWKDDYFGWETEDRAQMVIDSKGYTVKDRHTIDGRITIFVKT